MKYSQLLSCLRGTGLSPELLAPFFGVSNMTLRRWESKASHKIKSSELEFIQQGVLNLIGAGHLSAKDPQLKVFLNSSTSPYFQSAMNNLGVDSDFLHNPKNAEDATSSLEQIGGSNDRRGQVDSSHPEIRQHFSHGQQWRKNLNLLLKIIKSKKFNTSEKLVAYGALFYLITPFDFIPDHIPVFGLMDDFAIIGMAIAYYQKSFSKELSKS